MKKNYSFRCFIAFVALSTLLSGCGSTKKMSSYPGYQTKPSNEVQGSAANRGVKLEREECEVLATDLTAENPREFGNGVSAKESFATNLAILDARSRMAQRIKTYLKGHMVSADAQTQSNGSYTNKAGQTQTSQWDEYIANSRVIKKNTYVKEDGQYNVYVCIEMPAEELKKVYDALRTEKQISATITERMFIEGLKMISEE